MLNHLQILIHPVIFLVRIALRSRLILRNGLREISSVSSSSVKNERSTCISFATVLLLWFDPEPAFINENIPAMSRVDL